MTSNMQSRWIVVVITILLCSITNSGRAQSKIQVTSFQRMESDITARVTAPKRDQNGEVCALVRVATTVQDLMFEPDALGITARENKPGEIWLYIPRGARRISIMHGQLGVLRNYFYPDIIDKATVYEMVISTGDDVQKVPAATNTQLLIIRPEPSNADVYLDDEKVPTENGLFTATIKKGGHSYRVEAPMYAPESGNINLGAEQKIMSVTLKPRFGYMEVYSLPEQDANVYVDGALVGRTPYKSDRMALQNYKVRVEKQTYFPIDSTVTIKPGETYNLTLKMKSTIQPKAPQRTLIMAEAGYHPSQLSFGGMIGFIRKHGVYARFHSDFGSASTKLECNDEGVLTGTEEKPYYKEGVTHKSQMSVTAGYLRQLYKPLYGYAGLGYGNRTLAWETVGGELVRNTDHSATGVAVELGVIGRLNLFALSVGIQTINFKHYEACLGIGIIF